MSRETPLPFAFCAVFACLSVATAVGAQVVDDSPMPVEGSAEQVEESLGTTAPGRDDESSAEAAIAEQIDKGGAASAGVSPSEGKRVEEIIVSARRRAELLEETPISVTVLSDEMLKDTGTTQLNQIQNLVPNLTIFRTGSGQTISIVTRGVGNFPFAYYDQGTPLYVDGVVLSRNAGSVLDIVDIAQVEVLRGPQGTLFGKNSVGGAVSITTVKPQPELSASASIRAGSYGTFDSRAMLNLPVIEDKLFLRLNFASFQRDGYFTNTLNGEKLSDRNSQNFMVASRFVPNEDFTLDMTGSYSVSHTKGLGGQCRVIEPAFSDQIGIVYSPETGEQFKRRCNESGRFEGESDVARLTSIQSYGVWGNANYDFGSVGYLDDLAIRLTGAWRQQIAGNRDDLDGTASPVAITSTAGGGGSQFNGSPNWQNQIQTELQVNGAAWDEKINFVGGAFLFWERARTDSGFRFFENSDSALQANVLALGLSNNLVNTQNNDWALFGQATADFTDWSSLTAGVRYTEETKRLGRLLMSPYAPAVGSPFISVDFEGKAKFDAWTPMASLALTMPQEWLDDAPLEHLMGYFTYSRGFRGGGFNGGARTENPESIQPFLPEFINSYELGAKTISFDGRLSFNVAVFYAAREDQQVPQIISYPTPSGVNQTDVLTRNAADSTTKGVEVEFLTNPIDNLRIDGSMGFLNGVFGGFPGAQNARTGAPLDRDGQQITFVPRWQTHLGLQYSLELPEFGPTWLDGYVTPRVDWSFQSQTQYWVPELPEVLEPNRNIVNVRIAYDFNDNQSQVAFWGTNMTDHEYFQETVAIPRTIGVVTRYWAQPRTMGVEISHRF
ncbi:MAG: TonB-dependent receptor [Candidatus Binatia bacterium]|nr:TonB-dependent receptor [Candidatus Binatia bacterium]